MLKDISPKITGVRSAATELYTQPLDIPIGQLLGGSQMFSNSSRSGSGNNIFGRDARGIWLGAADFENAPFRVDMQGNSVLTSAIIAGSIFVGGAENGQIIVKDALGATIIILDNTGIEIDNGKLTIKDQNNTTIIDPVGLVSTANFGIASHFDNGTHTTNSTSPVDLSGSTLTTFTLSRNTKFQLSFGGYSDNSDFGINGDFTLLSIVDNGSLITFVPLVATYFPGGGSGIDAAYASRTIIVTFPSGSHTLKLQFQSVFGGNANIYAYDISYVQLGK